MKILIAIDSLKGSLTSLKPAKRSGKESRKIIRMIRSSSVLLQTAGKTCPLPLRND